MDIEQPTFIGRLIDDYKFVDGEPLGERNPKWLQDDYVKFIRFAQWRITKTGHGIVGYITNHSYLDNPTFRGMRQSLMETFNKIDIIDLHGNAKKKEVCPNGSKDENVFDIQQGVAIGIFTKTDGKAAKRKVRHADIWGARDAKQKTLLALSPKSKALETITPEMPMYYFVPRDTTLAAEYERFWKITDIFPVNGVGMTTARDHVVIDFERQPLLRRAKIFRDSDESNAELCRQLGIPQKKGWDINKARDMLAKENKLEKYVKPVLYRPFDERLIFYHDSLVWRTVKNVMRHMLDGGNIALLVPRQVLKKFQHVFCTNRITNFNALDTAGRFGSGCLFPLYLYRNDQNGRGSNGGGNGNGYQMMIAEPKAKYGKKRRPNLSREFVKEMAAALKMEFVEDGKGDLKKTFGPEDVFDYIYAIFHSPSYRTRYAEFLKSDFPRVPLAEDAKQFRKLASLGGELVALHLMESPKLERVITKYDVNGDHLVDRVRYVDAQKRVYINDEQFFAGVPKEVWEFQIGGYQVCEKWLKDRKGRKLTVDEISHYQRIVTALSETIRLMNEIDKAALPWAGK